MVLSLRVNVIYFFLTVICASSTRVTMTGVPSSRNPSADLTSTSLPLMSALPIKASLVTVTPSSPGRTDNCSCRAAVESMLL